MRMCRVSHAILRKSHQQQPASKDGAGKFAQSRLWCREKTTLETKRGMMRFNEDGVNGMGAKQLLMSDMYVLELENAYLICI